jgi:hypothetical protein
MNDMEEWNLKLHVFLISALDTNEWSLHAQGSHRCPFYIRLGVPQSRSGRFSKDKNLTLSGIELDVLGPARTVASILFVLIFLWSDVFHSGNFNTV